MFFISFKNDMALIIDEFVKNIFSLIQEGGHFLAKAEVPTLSLSYKSLL